MIDGWWMLDVTGNTISGSCRQSTRSATDRNFSEPGAPFCQSKMDAGWAGSRAGADGMGGGVSAAWADMREAANI